MKSRRHVLLLSIPLILAVSIASFAGLMFPETYAAETANWRAQAAVQDVVDLFLVVPLLTITSLFVFHGQRFATPLWGGALLYLLYTFVIYAFDVHFNSMFLIYVAALGFSAYGFIAFMRLPASVKTLVSERPPLIISSFFMIVALLFYFLWLTDLLPALSGGYVPGTLKKAGLFTNPVHVIDLSFFLPGIFVTGMLLRRHHHVGLKLAPVVLAFFVLMDITIAAIAMVDNSGKPGIILAAMMILLAIASAALLSWLMGRSSG